MTEFSGSERPRRDPEAAFRNYEGERVVVLPGRAEINVLNDAGGMVFELLDGQHSVDQIVDAVQEEYDVSREQAREDVLAFLADLAAHKMVV